MSPTRYVTVESAPPRKCGTDSECNASRLIYARVHFFPKEAFARRLLLSTDAICPFPLRRSEGQRLPPLMTTMTRESERFRTPNGRGKSDNVLRKPHRSSKDWTIRVKGRKTDTRNVEGNMTGANLSSPSPRPGRRWSARLVMTVVVLAILGPLVLSEFNSLHSAQQSLRSSVSARIATTAKFLSTSVQGQLQHESALAAQRLGSRVITQRQINAFAQDLQFGPSILTNSRGDVIAVIPHDNKVLGTRATFAHVRIALAGRRNVSEVTSSEVRHQPVIAFAVPFPTPYGRRVMSGTVKLSSSPLSEY